MKLGKKIYNKILDWKLSKKIVVSFFLLIIFPAMMFSFLFLTNERKSLIRDMDKVIMDSAEQMAAGIGMQMSRYEAVMTSVMMNTKVGSVFERTVYTYYQRYQDLVELYEPIMRTVQGMNPGIKECGVYTKNQTFTIRKPYVLPMEQIPEASWEKNALSDYGIHWFSEGNAIYAMGKLIKLTKNAPDSLAYFKINKDTLFGNYLSTDSMYGVQIYDNGRLLYEKIPENKDPANSKYVEQGINGGTFVLRLLVPEELHTPDMKKIYMYLGIMLFLCFLNFWLIEHLVSASVTERVEKLNSYMDLVEKGDLNIEFLREGNDEIGEMAGHYIGMVDSLKKHIEKEYISEITRQDAEMRALQSQINPHFLYNSLSMIRWMALEREDEETGFFVENLSKFYRLVLNRGNTHIKVSKEVEMIDSYLTIQSYLHDGSFRAKLDFAPEIMEYEMVGVILQPLVENAIEHGIDQMRRQEGILEVTGKMEDKEICFRVSNNGPKLSREQFEEAIQAESHGYGLKNVNSRLQIAYGADYGVLFDDSEKDITAFVVRIPV